MHGNYTRNSFEQVSRILYYIFICDVYEIAAAAVEWQIKKKKTHIVDFTNELKVPEFLLPILYEHHYTSFYFA